MAAMDPIEREQLAEEFRQLVAETSRRNAEARKFDAEAFKMGQEGRFYPFVVFGAGSLFAIVLGAAAALVLHLLGVPS